jgi:ribonuclease J
MAAKINVYQGDQIGGCITVIATDKTKIVIDFGDHIGRFMEIPDDVDLYMGEVTFKVMLNIRRAIKDEVAVAKLTERFEMVRSLLWRERFRFV